MTKAELETLLRKAGALAKERDFFLIGSQALRGVCPVFPRDFPHTLEADLYPRRHPQAWAILRQKLGHSSDHFRKYGYYLDCTDPCLSTLPEGWLERLVPFRTPRTAGVTAWCLEPHDLFISKLVVLREKDRQFLGSMLRHKLVRTRVILQRLECLPVPPARKADILENLKHLLSDKWTKSSVRRSQTQGKKA